jgi:hypothetical protein
MNMLTMMVTAGLMAAVWAVVPVCRGTVSTAEDGAACKIKSIYFSL